MWRGRPRPRKVCAFQGSESSRTMAGGPRNAVLVVWGSSHAQAGLEAGLPPALFARARPERGRKVGIQQAAIHISHLVKPGLTSQKSSSSFRLLPLHRLYVHICLPNNILFAAYSLLAHPPYVQPSMHKPRPRKLSSFPPFRLFFHHPPQRPVDLPLIPPPHPPEPRQHIRIQIHCHPLLRHPPPVLQLPRPLPPDFPGQCLPGQ